MYFAIVRICDRHCPEILERLIKYDTSHLHGKFSKVLVRAAAKVRNLELLITCLKTNCFIFNQSQIEWMMRGKNGPKVMVVDGHSYRS